MTTVAYEEELDLDCSGDSVEVAADTDGTDSVTIPYNCSTSLGGGTYQVVQDVIITASDQDDDGFSTVQSSCSLQGAGASADQ